MADIKKAVQNLSNSGWNGISADDKALLKTHYSKSDLQALSNDGWDGLSDSTKNIFRAKYAAPAAPTAPAPMSDDELSRRVQITNKGPLDVAKDLYGDVRGGLAVLASPVVGAWNTMTGSEGSLNNFTMARYKANVANAIERGHAGQGMPGLIADPMNVIGGTVLKGATRLGGTALGASRLAPAATAAYESANPLLRGALRGAAQGATIGAASSMDPTNDYNAVQGAIGGVLFGGTAGLAGEYLQHSARENFPGLNPRTVNRNVTPEKRRFVAENLDDILRPRTWSEWLPANTDELLNRSASRMDELGKRYEAGLAAADAAHPNLTIDLRNVEARARDLATKDLSNWSTPYLEYAPETGAGYRLPETSTDLITDIYNSARGSKMANLARGYEGGVHVNPLASAQMVNISQRLRANPRGIAPLMERLAADNTSVGRVIRSEAAHQGYTRPARDTPLTHGLSQRAFATTNDEAALRVLDAAVNAELANRVTPREASLMRSASTRPEFYRDPTGKIQDIKRITGLSTRDAYNAELKAIPEYAEALGLNKHARKGKVLSEGNVEERFALDKALTNVLLHPGRAGLQHRLNLGFANPSVEHTSVQSAKYLAGELLKRGLVSPVLAGKGAMLGLGLGDYITDR